MVAFPRSTAAVLLVLAPLVAGVATTRTSVAAAAAAAAAARAPTSPARWHLQRRSAILREHPEVRELMGKEPMTLPALGATNVAQIACAVSCAHLPAPVLVPLSVLVGGTLSLWQFALLHDVVHGTAEMPKGVRRNDVLFAGSLPALFGYYLYLRFGHLTHHKDFGAKPLRDLFDSEQSDFEDGDALFVAHRQQLTGDNPHEPVGFAGKEEVGGLGLSISRTIYSLLWLDAPSDATSSGADADGGSSALPELGELVPVWNACVFAFSMSFERAALVFGGGVLPAIVGRNFFFPTKPDDFHETCATYARVSMGLALALGLLAGPGAIAWLFWAEVGWQLPIHPASAMFVSNHPSLDAPGSGGGSEAAGGEGVSGCQPTASVYLGAWYDWLCCFSNFHTEHHDFPDVPAFRLRKLRDVAAPFYADDALAGCRDGWVETMRRTFSGREFYACSGVGTTADTPLVDDTGGDSL